MKAFKDFLDNTNLGRLPDSVREGFAKLTLSSNKKTNAKKDEQGMDNEKGPWKCSARKSLLELLTDDEDETEEDKCNKIFCSSNSLKEIKQFAYEESSLMENLFISDSEQSSASKNPGKKCDEEDIPSCSKSLFTRPDEEKEGEPRMADLFTDLRRLQLVEQKHLTPNAVCSLPDTVSNTESMAIKDLPYISRDSSVGDASVVSIVTISSSLSNDESSSNKVSDLSDDEVIVVSDSQSEKSESANVSPDRPSGQTNLGSTLSNTAAERIEKFLNDVAKTKAPDVSLKDNSFLNNSLPPTVDSSIPEESLEISETSSESDPEKITDQRKSAVPESNSKSTPQRTLSTASIQTQNGDKINIAATIKIKVHISEPIVTHQMESVGDESSAYSTELESTDDGTASNAQTDHYDKKQEDHENQDESSNGNKNEPSENLNLPQNSTDESAHECDDNGIDEQAKSILNSLYGCTWQTPDIIKTLKNVSKFDNNITPCMESTRIDAATASKNLKRAEAPSNLRKCELIEAGTSNTGRPSRSKTRSVNLQWINSEKDEAISDYSSFDAYISPKKEWKEAETDKLIYLDLSSDEVKIVPGYQTPVANNDKVLNDRLAELLKTCEFEEKPRLQSTTKKPGTMRKLYNPNFGEEKDEHIEELHERIKESGVADDLSLVHLRIPLVGIHPLVNKPVDGLKSKKLVFSPTGPIARSSKKERKAAPKTLLEKKDIQYTPLKKYSFLASLDVSVLDWACHPEAQYYKDNFKTKKEELTQVLYELYNKEVFNNKLDVPIKWNKRLTTTAGRCQLFKSKDKRTAKIELSEKVLTSADRVRCTLIHELCHAATWIFDGDTGHGPIWKAWTQKARDILPELPPIGICHSYKIQHKYTYRCTLCKQESFMHSKSKKVDQCRCSYCLGPIEVFLRKRNKNGAVMLTPVREPKGFAKYVKDNYKIQKKPGLQHADVMKILSNNFAALSVGKDKK